MWYWDEVNSLVSKCKRHILEGRDLFLLHDSMINLGRSSGSLGSEPECLAKGRGFSDHKPINPMSMTCEKVQLKPPRFSTHSVLLGGNIHIIYFPFEVWHVESLRHGPRFWFNAKHLDGGRPSWPTAQTNKIPKRLRKIENRKESVPDCLAACIGPSNFLYCTWESGDLILTHPHTFCFLKKGWAISILLFEQ